MDANSVQVGGTHYKSEYQHWDFAVNVGMDYLASAASKYVSRWRNKNGVEDLKKAKHYIEKLIEVSPLVLLRLQHCRPHTDYINAELIRFIRVNKLDLIEAQVCNTLALWTHTNQLRTACTGIQMLIDKTTENTLLEDSNKHADRE